jgi:hypothetical protein
MEFRLSYTRRKPFVENRRCLMYDDEFGFLGFRSNLDFF